MGEARLLLGLGRSLQGQGLAERRLYCSDEFQEGECLQTNRMTAGNRNHPGRGAIRPLDWQLDEPSLRMLGLYVLLPILAAQRAHHRQTHAPQRVHWEGDAHPS